MTPEFDKYIQSIMESFEVIEEAEKCDGPSLTQLSDKEGFRFMKCAENPYSPGHKRIYFGQKGRKVNIQGCINKPATKGQRRWEDCNIAIQVFKKRMRMKRRQNQRKK